MKPPQPSVQVAPEPRKTGLPPQAQALLPSSRARRALVLCTLSLSTLLSGCDGFFAKSTTGTGTGTGTGTTPTNPTNPTNPTTPAGIDLVFTANVGASTVTGFQISPTGALKALVGSPISYTNAQPSTLIVSRDNKYLWVGTQSVIFGFNISSTGALTAIASGAPLQNARCTDMQTSPDGKWLMVLDGSGNSIDLFAINTDGTLSPNAGEPFALSGIVLPHQLRLSPDGTLVAAAMGTAGEALFSFNTATGIFTQLGAFAPPGTSSDNGIAFDPAGTHLYIARSGTNAGLIGNSVAVSGSVATLTPTSATAYPAGGQPYAVTLDAAGKNVYVASRSDNNITGYSIGATGTLTALAGSPFSSGVAVQALGTDNSGNFLLAAAYNGTPDLTVYGYDKTTAGKLTPVTTAATGLNAAAIALSH